MGLYYGTAADPPAQADKASWPHLEAYVLATCMQVRRYYRHDGTISMPRYMYLRVCRYGSTTGVVELYVRR